MRIDHVSYRELKSGPGFTHEAVEMSAIVETGDSASEVLGDLRDRVREELGLQPTPVERVNMAADKPMPTEPFEVRKARRQERCAVAAVLREQLSRPAEEIGEVAQCLRNFCNTLDAIPF